MPAMRTREPDAPIAVIGLSCRLPGDASTPSRYWNLLKNGKSGYSEVNSRINAEAFYHPQTQGTRQNTIPTKGGYFLSENPYVFDAAFFNITAAEAISFDPRQRIAMEVAYEALENAGLTLQTVAGTQTACFMGTSMSDYRDSISRDFQNYPKYHILGVSDEMVANRLSHFLDIHGPSATVQSACSSSLVATHVACQSLRTGEADMAIAGGVGLVLGTEGTTHLNNLGFLNPAGQSRSFDADAGGYARGEGCGVVILKRLDMALEDGDNIRAVIRGTGVNSDGWTQGVTYPSFKAQASLIKQVYEANGLTFGATQYVEAHGTGTKAGDPIEARAIYDTIGQGKARSKLYVGSVKPNIGHLEAAAGIASIIKGVLSLENGMIPPNLNFQTPNPNIPLDDWNMIVPTKLTPWPAAQTKRMSISGFGMGGTNGHVIMEAHKSHSTLDTLSATRLDRKRLFPFSSHDKAGFERMGKVISDHLNDLGAAASSSSYLANLAYTLGRARSSLRWKSSLFAESLTELKEQLTSTLGRDVVRSPSSTPRLGFVFTGQGAQWARMGVELLDRPVFAKSIQRSTKYLKAMGADWDPIMELFKNPDESKLGAPRLSQPICSVLQIALVDELRSWGVVPSKVCGHSSGEIAAAYAAGALSHRDALVAAYFRGVHSSGPKMKRHSGGMMAVGCSQSVANHHLKELGINATIACVNSPSSVTISGDIQALDAFKVKLDEQSIFARRLKVEVAYHSPQMHACSMDYYSDIAELGSTDLIENAPDEEVVMVSSVSGNEVGASDLGPYYWVQNLISPVLFTSALKELVVPSEGNGEQTVDILLEIGPHGALGGPIEQILAEHGLNKIKYLSMLTRGENALDTAVSLAAELFTLGVSINVAHANGDFGCKMLSDLPPYAWNHSEEFRADGRLQREQYAQQFPTRSLLGAMQPTMDETARVWRSFINLNDEPWLRGHEVGGAVLFPAAGMVSIALEASQQLMDSRKTPASFRLRDISFLAAMTLSDNVPTEVIVTMRPHRLSTSGTSTPMWWEFNISSCAGPTGQLRENCRGLIDIVYSESKSVAMQDEVSAAAASQAARYHQLLDQYPDVCEKAEFYRQFAAAGVQYGEIWQGVEQCHPGDKHAVFNVRIHDIGETLTRGKDERPFLIHAATLDAAWQGYLGSTLGPSSTRLLPISKPMVPVYVRELEVSADIPWTIDSVLPGSCSSRSHGRSGLSADVTMFNEDLSKVVFSTVDYQLSPLETDEDDDKIKTASEIEGLTSEIRWDYPLKILSPTEISSILSNADDSSITGRICRFARVVIHQKPDLHIVEVAESTARLTDTILSKLPEGLVDSTQVHCAVSGTDFDLARVPLDEVFGTPFALDVASGNKIDAYPAADLILIPHETIISSKVDLDNGLKQLLESAKREAIIVLGGTAPSPIEAVFETLGFERVTVSPTQTDISIFRRYDGSVHHPCSHSKIVKVLESDDASSDAKEFSMSLRTHLSKQGYMVESTSINSDDPSESIYISILELDNPMLHDLSKIEFERIKKLLLSCSRLVWITAGDDPSFGVVDGLINALNAETGAHQFQVLHLTREGLSDGASLASRILNCTDTTTENIFRETQGLLQVPRLYRNFEENTHVRNHFLDSVQQTTLDDEEVSFRLDIAEPGMLDSLCYFQDDALNQSTLGDDELELDVKATGINFRDIMACMDLVESNGLGVEASGIVRNAGKNAISRFNLGDRVVTLSMGGAHATRTRCDYRITTRLTDSMSFEEAAASATVHTTANIALVKLARLREGQSILIHAASGGVGQAAIQWAHRLGLTIYATVGTDDKHQFLTEAYNIPKEQVFNSRDTSFVNAIHRITNGRGVDCVLNSLSGELLRGSWSCLASFGTFVEIGTRDITDNMRLDMRPFSKGTTFTSFDIPTYIQGNPTVLGEALEDAFKGLGSETLRPPLPLTVYPAGQAESALRAVQQGRHRGKLVLSFSDKNKANAPVLCRAKDSMKLDANATYLLVGGLGGLGRGLAKQFVASGARYIAFLSRSGVSKPEAKATVQELQTLGAQVTVLEADIGDQKSFLAAMDQCSTLPPIKGVIQMAIVLRDGPFENMSYDDWAIPLRPKIQGTQNLHHFFDAQRPLDFMIFCSSISGVNGSAGQSQYGAGNTYLDALAHYRRSQGLKAVSVNLGLMLDVGILHDMDNHSWKQWESYIGIGQRAFHALMKSIINGERKMRRNDKGIPAQICTGFGTADMIAAYGLPQPPWMSDVRFGPLAAIRSSNGGDNSVNGSAGASVASRLTEAGAQKDFVAAGSIIETAMVAKLADLLRVPTAEIESSRPLYTYGVDSLVALEVRNWIKQETKASVGLLDILAATPICDFAATIAQKSKLMVD